MSQRRKASQSDIGVKAKRARTSQNKTDDSGIELDETDKENHKSAEVGILESIEMKDFMCHKLLTFQFGANVNFIIGKNGSGKSAVLTGVMVGLGGNASCTNRGYSLGSFIKNGCKTADVRVKLRNLGRDAYKPDVYGKSIIVERHLMSKCSKYKLRAADNTVVSTKKEELMRILDQFNIQVDNPICILNQDASRHFLHSENSKNKYKLFLRATQLEQIRRADEFTDEQRRLCKSLMEQKSKSIPILEKEMADWKAKWDYHQSLSKYEDKIRIRRNELAWIHVVKLEEEFEKHRTKLAKLTSNVHEIDDRIEKANEELAEKKAAADKVTQELRAFHKELDAIRPRCLEAKGEMDAEKQKLTKMKRDQQQLQTDIRNYTKDRDQVIDKIKQIHDAENSNERQLRQQEIKHLQERREQLNKDQQRLELEYEHNKQQMSHFYDALYNDRQEENAIRGRLDATRRQLVNLEGSRTNNLRRFGNHMPAIQEAIEKANRDGRFRCLPKGPIGAYIKVKDAKYVLAVETCIKPLLFSFCCDNHNDESVLEDIFRRTIPGNARRPNIITSRFQATTYNVEQYAAFNETYPTVLEMIECDDAVVRNCLIDQRNIECVLLMDPGETSRRVMQRNPPRLCKEAYTTASDQIYPKPNYRFYSATNDKAMLLQESVEDAIRELKEQLQQAQVQLTQAQAKVNAGRADHAKADKQLKATEVQVMRTQQEIQRLATKLTELQNLDDPEPMHVMSLQEDLDQVSNNLVRSNAEVTALRESIRLQQEELQEASRRYDELEARRSTILTENLDPLKESLGKATQAIEKSESKLQHYSRIKDNHQIALDGQNALCLEKVAMVEKFTDIATTFGEKPDRVRDTATVQAEIDRLETTLETNAAMYGKKEDAQIKFTQASERCLQVQKAVGCLSQYLRTVDRMVIQRNKQYKLLRSYISIRINQYFTTLMSQRKFVGSLIFDHVRETLAIEVQLSEKTQSSKDMKGLSGGERSYSTVSFMLSLWEAIESPFHIMDEFDVFMDMVNRRISMDIMINTAYNKKLNQFLFLTPLEMTNLTASDRVRIFKMKDPERNQGVIPFKSSNSITNDDEIDEDT